MIEFNVPAASGRELEYLSCTVHTGKLGGDGLFTGRCEAWLAERLRVAGGLLVHSCTAALEIAALLCDLRPGDEVLMPSYTFVSTASAVVLRGAAPVFIDIREDTLNLDERLLEGAITNRTRAIFPVHYAGVCAEMDEIAAIAARRGLMVVEDAAQALGSTYRGRPAGTLGDFGCFSFHETKNLTAGEGGALVARDARHFARARILRDKGTNRRQFLEGQVDKYTWVDVGSSYAPSEIGAAFLWGQLENIETINHQRIAIWESYHAGFEELEARGRIRRPIAPDHCRHNGHLYYLLLEDRRDRDGFIEHMRRRGVQTPFHYVPLHASPAGRRFGRAHGPLTRTVDLSDRLVRLPLHLRLGADQAQVIAVACEYLHEARKGRSCAAAPAVEPVAAAHP
jgi:dTDP-4-amino-4,6-dideoxygalactose transaminase